MKCNDLITIIRDKHRSYITSGNGVFKHEVKALYDEYKKLGGTRGLKEILKTEISY